MRILLQMTSPYLIGAGKILNASCIQLMNLMAHPSSVLVIASLCAQQAEYTTIRSDVTLRHSPRRIRHGTIFIVYGGSRELTKFHLTIAHHGHSELGRPP